MRILHLISQHPEATGSGVSLQNIISRAAQAGHDNFLIAGISDRPRSVAGLSPQQCMFVRFGLPPLEFPIPGMSDVMPYPSSRFSELSSTAIDAYEQAFGEAISEALEKYRPDIIHSHHLWLMTAVACRLADRLPIVTSCHSTDLRQLTLCPHLRDNVVPWCRQVNRVLALTGEQACRIADLYAIGKDRIDIVGGGFDLDCFSFGEKKTTVPVQLLYAGKLSLAKGVDWLLMAMERLSDLDIHLHLAGSGSGEEERYCLRLAARLGSRVTAHGRLDQAGLATLMRHCHIFVLPSFYEGLPLVLLEALASGCRLVTTALPGTVELLAGVDRSMAQLIPLPAMERIDRPDEWQLPGLVEDLALALKEMVRRVRDDQPPSAALCREMVRPFTWSNVFSQMERSYVRALSGCSTCQ